jgi:hypothetical protein
MVIAVGDVESTQTLKLPKIVKPVKTVRVERSSAD